jgi:hypothetical protein
MLGHDDQIRRQGAERAAHDDQIRIHKQTATGLEKQLVRAKAEVEATQNVVDILVEQGSILRLERESLRLTASAVINAASEICQQREQELVHVKAQCLAWRSIALAIEMSPLETLNKQATEEITSYPPELLEPTSLAETAKTA